MNCAQPCCLEWLSHIGGRVRERAATAHNAHLSEHFLLQTHSLCTMHTMSICLNISLWQNINFALCKKNYAKAFTMHLIHRRQSTFTLDFTLHISPMYNNVQCLNMMNVRYMKGMTIQCSDSDMKANSRFHPRPDSYRRLFW